jgi:hypothetical protein
MHKKIYLLALINCIITSLKAQEVLFGANNYIEYQIGTLPIVISVSHGGQLEPTTIPDRTCNNPVFAMDAFTVETALEIKQKLFERTGCYPHIIISHLKRSKLDPNRNITDGACGHPDAIIAWQEFHDFISTARDAANEQYQNHTFFIDLHGHGNTIQRIELGYLLYDYELELSDITLNTAQYINYSSIRNLAISNLNNFSHAELLRGPFAFGSLLVNQNYPAVPSQDIPFPGASSNYFSGGYITANHTCYHPDAPINGLQMELNFNNIRDTPANRSEFASAFSQAFLTYMNTHFGINWNNCTPLEIEEIAHVSNIQIYPNPVKRGEEMHFLSQEYKTYEYHIFDLTGQRIAFGSAAEKEMIDTSNLVAGIYILHFSSKEKTDYQTIKIVVQ